jgi:pimeloyl-ACP methyl ester carboxylesterase
MRKGGPMNTVSLAIAFLLTLALGAGPAAADEFDSKGVKIHYVVEGKGEPVVLIHGLQSSAAINWELPGTLRQLASRYQVIAFDCRGHGQSGKPTAEDQYGVEMVEDVTRLLDHLKIEKAHIVGYSMGGMIAMKFIVLHPDRVKSGVLGGMGWLKSGSVLEKFWEKLPAREEGHPPTACLHGLSQLGVTEDEVRAVQAPVALVAGDHDPCRKLYIEPLLKVRPEWTLTTVEGAGHLTCIAKEAFKDAVKDALDARSGK